MAVTIKDIAKHLDLAPSTISKALNDYPNIAPETRTRVIEASRELGYVPSSAARSLRRRKTNRIGLVITYPVAAISEYLSQLTIGAALAAEIAEHKIMLYTTASNHYEQIKHICRSREVDGLLVIWSTPMEDSVPLLLSEEMPFVAIARRVADRRVSYVVGDNQQGALELTRHLIAMGHRRIGFTPLLALKETNQDRLAGYRQGLKEAGIRFDESLLAPVGLLDGKSRYEAMNTLLDLPDPPTAVFTFHDFVAIEALRAAHDRGLRVPDDVAIAGFDGNYSSMITSPPLTTVKQPVQEIGQQALKVLLNIINNKPSSPQQIILPVELLPRQSTTGLRYYQQ